MKIIFSFVFIILFIGCGYKPSSYYARDAITGNVYVKLDVDISNAQNSVYVKDAMNEMIINQFKANLTDNKKNADTIVIVSLSNVSHLAMSTDDNGYVESYRTTVNITVKYQKRDEAQKTIKASNYYDYTVDSTSIVTDQKKNLAVKIASTKAFTDVFSKIAIKNMKK